MINHDCTSLEWITRVSALHNNADKILVEKVIRALMLLEGLAVSGLDFCFKGGTATMLLLEKPRRMSIDIDIIVPDANADIPATLDKVCAQQGFTGWTVVERQNKGLIHKTHYKLYFLSNVSRAREQFILLDVLHEQVGYSKTIQKPLTSSFIENEDAAVLVTMPDINSITGDKLTAFSPNTIGIPYNKGGYDRGMEIIKQLYDLSCLYEQVDDISIVREVFERFCAVESKYREHGFSPEAVLEDAQINALSICFRKAYDERCQYEVERFSNEKAMVHAAKVAYLVELVKQGINQKVLFDPAIDMKNWLVSQPSDTRINKVKKSSPEGFFYLYHMVQLQEKA